MVEIKYSLAFPPVDKPHEALYAFLRTSEWGEWQPSKDEASDAFVQNYIRGKGLTKGGLFSGRQGMLAPEDPISDANMKLRVTLRPSPSVLTVRLFYSMPSFVSRWTSGTLARAIGRKVGKHIKAEAEALASYLRDVYELPELPQIEQQD